MLILTMNIGKERYGINTDQVAEVIPLINLDQIPMVDKIISGIFNYRGRPTPVIDLCQFFEKRCCTKNQGSRIIIIEPDTEIPGSRPIGLIAERVTEVLKCTNDVLISSGIKSEATPFLGEIFKHGDDMLQLIDTRHILPVSIANQIFVDDETTEPVAEQ
jgi:chemotaxis-related protein WspB